MSDHDSYSDRPDRNGNAGELEWYGGNVGAFAPFAMSWDVAL
jgi:hypothetical protein